MLCKVRVLQASVVISRPLASASDPVQKLFLEKVREYRDKSVGGKLVEPSPAIEKELKAEISKLEKHYGVDAAVDMTSFPSFTFEEPKIDPIDEQVTPPPKQQQKK